MLLCIYFMELFFFPIVIFPFELLDLLELIFLLLEPLVLLLELFFILPFFRELFLLPLRVEPLSRTCKP